MNKLKAEPAKVYIYIYMPAINFSDSLSANITELLAE
jgi:hypothetical protein